MKNESLHRQLRAFGTPAPSASARARAKHRAMLALQQKVGTPESIGLSASRHRVWLRIVTVGLIAIAVTVWWWPRGTTENLASDRQILRQVEQLFPHQLNAVVQKGGQTSLALTQSAGLGSDQPVLLIFKRQNEVIRVLSFSGHRVCVPLGARDACFEVLETADGGVILENDTDVLLASRHPMIAGYALRARTFSL